MTSTMPVTYGPRPSSLADVVDLILDKGLVIDAYVRVSLVGIELLTIDARIVVASVDTYLRFAEAVNRLDLRETETAGLKGLTSRGQDDDDHDGESRSKHEGRPRERRALPSSSSRRQHDDDNGHDGRRGEHGEPGLLQRLGDRARFEPARRERRE